MTTLLSTTFTLFECLLCVWIFAWSLVVGTGAGGGHSGGLAVDLYIYNLVVLSRRRTWRRGNVQRSLL